MDDSLNASLVSLIAVLSDESADSDKVSNCLSELAELGDLWGNPILRERIERIKASQV